MKRWLLRTLPALGVAAILILAARGAVTRAGESGAPELDASTSCNLLLQGTNGGAQYYIPPNEGIAQPVGLVGNVAACSLDVTPTYTHAEFALRYWDPVLLAPDPTTIALRTRFIIVSELYYNHYRIEFSPPVVTRVLAGVAEAPPLHTVVDFRNASTPNYLAVGFESSGDPAVPEALRILADGSRIPFVAPHALISHAICGGGTETQSQYVAQSVVRTDEPLQPSEFEVMQRFRVPHTVSVSWFEFANVANYYRNPFVPGLVAILDAQGQSEPPWWVPQPLIFANLDGRQYGTPSWMSHFSFNQSLTLQPDHDYWLLVRTEYEHGLYMRQSDGSESPAFSLNIGPLYGRTTSTGTWELKPQKALSFRLVGTPLGTVDVPPTSLGRSPLHLAVSPNPSRGLSFVNWSGAEGSTRIELLDPSGRQVGVQTAVSGSSGRWACSARGADGRALPAGVYFVRAIDSIGKTAVSRLVLVP